MSSVRRLVPLHALELSSDPENPRVGDIYYNNASEELRVYTGDVWQPVGGAISGILEHVHTYDGAVYSVSAVQIPNPGIIDGGDA